MGEEMMYWIIIAVIIILVIMRKRIVRFLRKLGLWKKAQDHKEKYPPYEPLPPVEPEKPIENPEPEKPVEPTEENPVITEIIRGTSVKLEWLPVPNVSKYLVEIMPEDKRSFITRGRDVTRTEYTDYKSKPGDKSWYRIWAGDKEILIGAVEIEVPELPERFEFSEFPDKIPANAKEYHIYDDPSNSGDQTPFIKEQWDKVPNGTKDEYVVAIFHVKNNRVRVEGDLEHNPRGHAGGLSMVGRRYVIIKAPEEQRLTFYTTDPATPLGSSVDGQTYSQRPVLKIEHFNNVWLYNVTTEGGNTFKGDTIGNTPEETPSWWWKPYEKGDEIAHWWLFENEERLRAGREIPQEITGEKNDKLKEHLYTEFLTENVKEGENIPRHNDTGATKTSMVWQPEWENESGIDARYGNMLKLTNYQSRNVFGDGISLHDVEGVIMEGETLIESVGRQNVGLGRGVKNFKVKNLKSLNPRRSPFDIEPYWWTEVIDGVYVEDAFIDGRVSGAGDGTSHNVTFKNCERIVQMTMIGDPERIRENLVVDGTKDIGGFQTPLPICRYHYYRNLTITNNHWVCPNTHYAARKAFQTKGSQGTILIEGNTYEYPSIVEVLECPEGTEVIINEDYPENVYVVEIGGKKEIIGTNPELLAKLK